MAAPNAPGSGIRSGGRSRRPGSCRRTRTTAVVELAAASGLSRLPPDELRSHRGHQRGTGELLRAALDAGVRHIVLGIGGSATTDGGRGILEALGAT